MTITVSKIEDIDELTKDFTFPATLRAAFAFPNWKRTASDLGQLREFLVEGLDKSPIEEVQISWE